MDFDGILFFPVTPFDAADRPAVDTLAAHVAAGLRNRPGGVFVACGTGEFHALAPDEFSTVVRTAVTAVAGAVPVVAGAGGPLPVAVDLARRAAEAGADGLLLMPPYLVTGPPEGLYRYVRAVAAATDLPVIVYQRMNAVFPPALAVRIAALPTVVGLKDGVGDLDAMRRIVLAVHAERPDFLFFNGLPTAELTAPAYRATGVPLYSSAAFAFVPEVAVAFWRALDSGDTATVHRLQAAFYLPLVQLRDAVPGYAVALVKAGVRLRGLDVGGVRPPLIDPGPEHLAELEKILAAGLAAV